MTTGFPPERVPARGWTPTPAGWHAATDPLVAWATAPRDSEHDAYLTLYAALYPPPYGSLQERAS